MQLAAQGMQEISAFQHSSGGMRGSKQNFLAIADTPQLISDVHPHWLGVGRLGLGHICLRLYFCRPGERIEAFLQAVLSQSTLPAGPLQTQPLRWEILSCFSEKCTEILSSPFLLSRHGRDLKNRLKTQCWSKAYCWHRVTAKLWSVANFRSFATQLNAEFWVAWCCNRFVKAGFAGSHERGGCIDSLC